MFTLDQGYNHFAFLEGNSVKLTKIQREHYEHAIACSLGVVHRAGRDLETAQWQVLNFQREIDRQEELMEHLQAMLTLDEIEREMETPIVGVIPVLDLGGPEGDFDHA